MLYYNKRHKCNQRISNTPNSSSTNLQPPTSLSSLSTDNNPSYPTYYHHHQHQHTHNHFLHSTHNQTNAYKSHSSPTPCCDFKKLLIYTLLFFVAYYLLFLALSTTYKHHKHKSPNSINTILIETPIQLPQLPPDPIDNINQEITDVNTDNTSTGPDNINLETDLINNKLERNKSQREKFLERKRKRREQRKARLARLRGEEIPENKPLNLKPKHEDIYESLDKFTDLYISDNPYFLDNNIVIIGQLSNAELHLKSILSQLLSVSCLFNSTTFILFESNSIDDTTKYLNEFVNDGSINCTNRMFNPMHVRKYGNMRSLDELMNVFDSSLEEYNNSNSVWDDIVYGILSNYTKLSDIDMKEIEWLLNEQITASDVEVNEIEIEEIIYEKLSVIKYIKYFNKILESEHYLNKYVITGDEYVRNELDNELEILKMLNLYDGVNEFHMDRNGNIYDKRYNELERIRFQHGNIHTLNDFRDEFNEIHNEMEGLIENDEDIIYQKLKDKQLAFAKKRKELRKQRLKKQQQQENNNEIMNEFEIENDNKNKELEEQRYNEYYSRFRNDKLYRIERFVIYRNMLLNESRKRSMELGINFDYIMAVDMDIYSMDVRTFMNELYYSPDELNGICIDGIDWYGFTRDTFATVKSNGGWLHYGHDTLVNDTYYIYNNDHAMYQRTLIPNHKKSDRYYEVKSCFGGVIVYKNYMNELFNSECKYTLTRDIFYKTYNNSNIEKYTYKWWLNNRYHNKYSEESKLELQLFREQYIEILQMEDKRIADRSKFPKDGDICEHIPFHYCLYDYGWKFAISARAKLYYDELYPINRKQNDTNWKYYFGHRPKYTL